MALNFGVLSAPIAPPAWTLIEHARFLDAHGYDCLWATLDQGDLLYDIATQINHLK